MFALSGLNNLTLLDLGVPLREVGFVTGSLSPVINLVMAVVSGVLVRRVGTLRLITVSALGVIAGGGLMIASAAIGSATLAIAATILGIVGGGGLGVPVFNMIYRWAQGLAPPPITRSCSGRHSLPRCPCASPAPALAAHVGWPGYFTAAILFYTVAFAALRATIRRTSMPIGSRGSHDRSTRRPGSTVAVGLRLPDRHGAVRVRHPAALDPHQQGQVDEVVDGFGRASGEGFETADRRALVSLWTQYYLPALIIPTSPRSAASAGALPIGSTGSASNSTRAASSPASSWRRRTTGAQPRSPGSNP